MAKATNPRQIKRQIRSVQNLKKITKAMEMVSAAKLRRVQGGLLAIRPYSDKLRDLVQGLAARAGGEIDAPLLKPREEIRRVGYVVFASDKGLCGSYNANLLRLFERELKQQEHEVVIFSVGRKVADHLRKLDRTSARHWQGLPTAIDVQRVRELTEPIVGAYRRGEVDEVHLVYTAFVSAGRYHPRSFRFLPFDAGELVGRGAGKEDADAVDVTAEGAQETIFEPDPERILAALIPRYVEILFYRTLLEALASEHAARMTSMHNATENAQDMVRDLTLTYNKVRQASITKELLDIVGGAEALRG